jgi:YVTN family beta-propeller protein
MNAIGGTGPGMMTAVLRLPMVLRHLPSRRARCAALVATLAVAAAACGGGSEGATDTSTTVPATTAITAAPATTTTAPAVTDVYANTRAGMLAPSVQDIPTRVYVPNGQSATVSVIDPATYQVVDTFPVGRLPQHVVPSYNMQTLYVNNNQGNSLTPIDPRTGKPGPEIAVNDPYNLYFTPDGTKALVMAERESKIDVRDPTTWQLITSIPIPHAGVNHADFSADGTTMLASCEFSGWVERIDLATMQITGEVNVGGQPIDIRISPDGTKMYVANQVKNGGGISIIDPAAMIETAFIQTGDGAHGLYPSRDGTTLYITNRKAGTVTVLAFATDQIVGTWTIPGGGSPDMGGVSADGREFWVSGRYNNEVYVFDTTTGQLTHRIPVGSGPHGLAIFPQPGRFSLGHTANYR